ncbi:hypothetical protein ABFV43_22210, partial [Pseudomonas fulva]|uniref:hypothetical protein n=1 Tax=Pseudomonas fulva TaxID=47880 RepID=UPI0034D66859
VAIANGLCALSIPTPTQSNFKLQTSNFKLQTSNFKHQTSNIKLQSVGAYIELVFIGAGGAQSPFRPYGGSLFVLSKSKQKP